MMDDKTTTAELQMMADVWAMEDARSRARDADERPAPPAQKKARKVGFNVQAKPKEEVDFCQSPSCGRLAHGGLVYCPIHQARRKAGICMEHWCQNNASKDFSWCDEHNVCAAFGCPNERPFSNSRFCIEHTYE